MYRNIAIIQNIVNAMRTFRSDTLLLLVANPVDLLTSLALGLSGLPTSSSLGLGHLPRLGSASWAVSGQSPGACTPLLRPQPNPANPNLGRGKFNRSLRIRCAWGVTGCCLVDCKHRRRLYRQIASGECCQPPRASK